MRVILKEHGYVFPGRDHVGPRGEHRLICRQTHHRETIDDGRMSHGGHRARHREGGRANRRRARHEPKSKHVENYSETDNRRNDERQSVRNGGHRSNAEQHQVVIQRHPGVRLGVGVTVVVDRRGLFIDRIAGKGVMADWNRRTQPPYNVQPSARVGQANGVPSTQDFNTMTFVFASGTKELYFTVQPSPPPLGQDPGQLLPIRRSRELWRQTCVDCQISPVTDER